LSLAVTDWPVDSWADRRSEFFTNTRASSSKSLSDTDVTVFLLSLTVTDWLIFLGASLDTF